MFRLGITLFMSLSLMAGAQKIKKEDYLFIDHLAVNAGPMKDYGLQYIVDSITKQCKTELQATRAFYRWEAKFILFDMKRYRHPGNAPDNASSALMERKAASEGFARLFKAMCDLQKIECVVVKGIIRRSVKDIGRFDDEAVHYWNIVTIKNTHYLIDAALGSGYLDEKRKHFIAEYTDAWWLCNRRLFANIHFPDDKMMQLLESPLTKTAFIQGPIVYPGAIVAGLVPTKMVKGMIRGSEDSSTDMKFILAANLDITQVEISFDKEKRIPVLFDFDAHGVYLKVPNGPSGKHIAELFIKNKLYFSFKTEARKGRKKK